MWLWMLYKLVMAGPSQLVVHNKLHDLESFFYVLIRICILYNGPVKSKPDVELKEYFNKLFNTSEPRNLKMITIQSFLAWVPSVIKHILPDF